MGSRSLLPEHSKGHYSRNCELDGIGFITGQPPSTFWRGQAAVMAHPLGNAARCFTQRTHLPERSFYAIPSGRFGPAQILRTATCDRIADNCGIYIGQGRDSAAYTTAEYTYGDQDWSTETRRRAVPVANLLHLFYLLPLVEHFRQFNSSE